MEEIVAGIGDYLARRGHANVEEIVGSYIPCEGR
jgi:hypothetical protein